MTLARLVLALAALFPRLDVAPGVLAAIHAAAERHRVPPALLAATCLRESTLRTRGALLCGVYGAGRAVEAQADAGARVLRAGLDRCRTWEGASAFHYSGACSNHAPPRRGVHDPISWGARTARLAAQIGGVR